MTAVFTVSPKTSQKLPQHLLLRGSTYYFRLVVPAHLRKHVGKREFLVSLQTSDEKLALSKIGKLRDEAVAILKEAEARVEKGSKSRLLLAYDKSHERRPLVITSEWHIRQLTRQWFLMLERDGCAWWREVGLRLSQDEIREVLADLDVGRQLIMGLSPRDERYDGESDVRQFLERFNLSLSRDTEGYQSLVRHLPSARLEFIRRQQDRLSGKEAATYDHSFKDLNELSPDLPISGGVTLERLTERFVEEIAKAGRSKKTVTKYRSTGRLLCEIFGGARGLESFERADVEHFASILDAIPSNAKKRYPRLSIADAIEEADRREDPFRLMANTKRDRFYNAFTIFRYAVDTKGISENPFNDLLLKQRFRSKDDDEEPIPFETEQLRAIFNAPLFTGSMDDQRGYAKPGSEIIRRGRFWVPLIALFQGARLNEICQLHTADVQEWEGGLSLNIREGDDRQLKNKPSRRIVPMHPELLKMGFVQFLASRRNDTESPRLFPELPLASTGSYSDNFSKWFANFLRNVFGEKIEPTFHNLRHTFVTACRVADISPQRIDRLCGWASGSRQQRAYGAAVPVPVLAEDLQKVRFDGLDLSHLYLPSPENAPSTPKVRPKSRQVTV